MVYFEGSFPFPGPGQFHSYTDSSWTDVLIWEILDTSKVVHIISICVTCFSPTTSIVVWSNLNVWIQRIKSQTLTRFQDPDQSSKDIVLFFMVILNSDFLVESLYSVLTF
jgi:hypothetical protein